MTLKEKSAYIKGLTDGLKLNEDNDEVKVIKELVNMLSDITSAISELTEATEQISNQIDIIDEDISDLENYVYEDDDYDFCGNDCHNCDNCEDYEDLYDEDAFYEVTCPNCGNDINVEEEVLLCGETVCPNCGEIFEFDFSPDSEDKAEEKE